MATFNSATYNLQKTDRANTSRNLAAGVVDGTVEFATFSYALAGTEATSDVINLCVLPAGVTPLPALSKVTCSADPGTTLTLDIGTAADLDGWADGIVLSAGGDVNCTNTAIPAWAATMTPIIADSNSGNAVVKATVASAATLTASVILLFTLAYKRNK